ncbi:MAG: ABC transporter ATP-binding protein [Firmicutes bacterium]|nr:ABC transporter ATP-binding protein [Bacillota bacterium]
MEQWALITRELRKEFGHVTALAGLNLQVKRGEIFGLVGPDGAGKTTAIRLFCGLIDPTAGICQVFGHNLATDAEAARLKIGYMSQRFSLYRDLTVIENLCFFADIYQVPRPVRDQRIESLLNFTRLQPFTNRLAEDLSGGMKQKLALACTVLHEPELILLDEPTTGVDPVSRREFWDLLREMNQKGTTIIVSTPYMDEAERCQTIAFLHQGRVLHVGSPMEIRRLMKHEIIEIKAKPKFLAKQVASKLPGVNEVSLFGDKLHLVVNEAVRVLPGLQAGLVEEKVEVVEIRRIMPSLEDVFLYLLKERGEAAQ